jgi:hypothetical protein
MFFAKTFNNIIKKQRLFKSRYQSTYHYNYKDNEVLYFKINEKIQVKIERYCNSLASLSFVNEKRKPIRVPKLITLKKLELEEFIRPEKKLNNVETPNLIWFRGYKMFWKGKTNLKIGQEPRIHDIVLTEELDRIK